MIGGFSFCGIDIADLGLEYAPENKDTYVYKPTTTNIHEEVFDGHDGGYYFGATKEPKEFILKCFYQDSHVSEGIMTKAHNVFRKGRSGLLVFKKRPWCYYYATVTDVDTTEMYNYLNGLFVVTMKAYYPLARGLEVNGRLLCNLPDDPYHDDIMLNTALLESEEMVPQTMYTTLPSNPILLYNPGTERADVGIVISGSAGGGVTIRNLTTDQSCRYTNFDTGASGEIYTDGINGKTILNQNGVKTLAFMYHDFGFIELEPAYPIIRSIDVSYNGTTVTTTENLLALEPEPDWYAGKYIYLDDAWYKIVSCDDLHTLTISSDAGEGVCTTDIVLMNEINVITSQNTDLLKISFVYKPTFA